MSRARYMRESLAICIAAMKSCKTWAKDPTRYNQLFYALMATGENLESGRPSNEDPDNSAAYGKIGSTELSIAFNILREVAEHNGAPFFEFPEGAAGELKRIALHFHALNLGSDPYADGTEVAGVRIRENKAREGIENVAKHERFSLIPIWPMGPVEKNPDGDEPLVIGDGLCGHTNGIPLRASKCNICAPSWLSQYSESVERRRAWQRRRDEREAREGAVQKAADKLLEERRREMFGVKDCHLPHSTQHSRGDIVMSSDGSRCWTYVGNENSDPALPWNWAIAVNRNKNAIGSPIDAKQWNETGLNACPKCDWTPEVQQVDPDQLKYHS